MVDFYVSKLKVAGFRGLREFELSFDPDLPSVVVGPNNTGKTTLLDAIGLGMGSAKFSRYDVSDGDFWQGKDGEPVEVFVIDLKFGARTGGRLPAVKGGLGNPVDVHGIRTSATLGESSVTRHLVDDAGTAILLNLGTPISKGQQDDYRGMGLTGRRYATVRDVSKWMPEVWQLDTKNLFLSLYEWKSGPLQRLLAIYKEHLLSDEWTTDSGRKMPDSLGRLMAFLREQALRTPFWKETLAPGFQKKMEQYLGREPQLSVTPGLNDIDSWILSELQVRVSPADDRVAVDCRRLGDGWQSLMRMASLELVNEIEGGGNGGVLLMEEPESYLHPHLRRKLRSTLGRLQAQKNQIVVCTHSPELISFTADMRIVRLSCDADGTTARTYNTSSADVALKTEEKFHERGKHELIFANRVVLTEGKPDEAAVLLGLKRVGVDVDGESVSVVDCGGVDNLPAYASVCASLGIPWFAVHDADVLPGGSRKANTDRARVQLDALKTARDGIAEWDNDLEGVFGLSSGKLSPAWLAATFDGKDWAKVAADPVYANYISVVNAIDSWLA